MKKTPAIYGGFLKARLKPNISMFMLWRANTANYLNLCLGGYRSETVTTIISNRRFARKSVEQNEKLPHWGTEAVQIKASYIVLPTE